MAENIKDLIDSFPDANSKQQLLHQLKVFISKCPKSRLREDLTNVKLQKFFATFPSLDEEEMKLCCEVIDSLFVCLNPEIVISNYSKELKQGLDIDNTPVQLICLAEVKRLPIDLYESFLFKDGSVVASLIHLIGREPLQVGLSSVSALSRLGECKGRPADLFKDHFHLIKGEMAKSDVVRFRFYELFMNLASTDAANLKAVVETGFLSQLLTELFEEKNPDILAQMNCIELLNNLAMTNHGFTWMDEQGILDRLEVLISKINSESILSLLLPGLLVFFGCLAKGRPNEICNKYKRFMENLFTGISSSDMTLRGISLETLAHIGSTICGKQILGRHPRMEHAIVDIGATLRDCTVETKARALNSLYHLLEVKPKDQTPELLAMTEKWFTGLGDDSFKTIYNFCNQPFENVRVAGHRVMLALAYQPWGQTLMRDDPTFQVHLLNRAIETEINWKFSKFKIVEAMMLCSFTKEIFGSEYYQKLSEHHKAGPNYIEAESAVALEEAS